MRERVSALARKSILLASVSLLAPVPAHAAPPTVTAIRISGLTRLDEASVRTVLPITEGAPYSPEAIAATERILNQWGRFDTVIVRPAPHREGIDVDIELVESQLIGEIKIRGNYPFIQNKIRRQLTMRPGDRYDPGRIAEQIDRIKNLYDREGFHNTAVEVTTEWQPYTSDLRVDVFIRKGATYTPGRITVRGNTVLPRGRFVTAVNNWRRYTTPRVREAMAKLRAVYRKRGYPRARIRLVEETLNPKFHEIDLAFAVEEGPHVIVRYEGNRHLSDHLLTRTLTIFREGRTDAIELEASAEAIAAYYRKRGFPDARATFTRREIAPTETVIVFTIDEGIQQRVRRVEFAGASALGAGRLQSKILTRPLSLFHKGAYDPQVAADDATVLEQEYRREGFLNAVVAPPAVTPRDGPPALDVVFPIEEDGRYHVRTVRFDGNLSATHDTLLKDLQLRPGVPVNPERFAADKNAILLYYRDHGFPYAEITQAVVRDDDARAVDLHYTCAEGIPVRIGEILFVGDFLTSQRALRRAMSVKAGDPYSEQKILASQLGIRRLGAFRSVGIETIGLAEHAAVVPLRVRVEEENPFILDIDLGYSTDESFTGSLAFTNINSFGWAKRTQFRLTGGRQLSRAEVGWIDPRFFGRDLQWTTNTWAQYENRVAFNYIQTGGSVGLFRQFHRTGFHLRYSLERNNFLGGDSVAADAQSLRDSTLSIVGAGASWDTRNNFADPTKGIFASLGADFLTEIKGNEANFVLVHGGISHYWELYKGLVLAQYGRLAGIQTLGRNISVPSNKLLFMGGDDTIRGFSEDSLGPTDVLGRATGGRVRWIYNAEATAKLGGGLKAAVFFDIGALTNRFADLGRSATRESLGFGLRYMTPVGPLRADYGFKLGRRAGESVGRIHLTFGHVF
ncbi:MAG: BamA/TamA family outer membrane protein [Deltaproteobacteria bacterium]|nr:BamA/TamA family outer membrane protein [Deltaproteobacteria bacterium]